MSPIPVIIDTDPGVDDILALLLAFSSPHLVVVGITLTHGNTTLSYARQNLEKLLYALDQHLLSSDTTTTAESRWRGINDLEWRKKWGGNGAEQVRVWMGSEGPLEGQAVTAKYFHGKDGLADCETLYPELTPPEGYESQLFRFEEESAKEGIEGLVRERKEMGLDKLHYIALGPLTSLAQLAQEEEGEGGIDLEKSFETISSMGGAVEHPGNTTPVAEFNYYADPYAARKIFSLSLPNLYVFPLDLTSYLTLPFSLYTSQIDPDLSLPPPNSSSLDSIDRERERVGGKKDPLVHFTTSFLRGTKRVMESFGGDAMELHDPTVVYASIEYAARRRRQERQVRVEEGNGGEFAEGWEWKRVDFEVECDGTLTRGMLVPDHRASSKTSTSITSRTGQTNRALAVKQDTSEIKVLDLPEVEARQVEEKEGKRVCGAKVVVKSPGSERMRKEMLEMVWGVTMK
ncbi:hypothetical protein JCM16303_001064 [Sporobolomyces ruberrimus]